jgi:TusA-related sulfurtransferase
MVVKTLDITGKVCPYCLMAVKKAGDELRNSDELVVTTDHPVSATASIPEYARNNGMDIASTRIASGVWEIRLTKK